MTGFATKQIQPWAVANCQANILIHWMSTSTVTVVVLLLRPASCTLNGILRKCLDNTSWPLATGNDSLLLGIRGLSRCFLTLRDLRWRTERHTSRRTHKVTRIGSDQGSHAAAVRQHATLWLVEVRTRW